MVCVCLYGKRKKGEHNRDSNPLGHIFTSSFPSSSSSWIIRRGEYERRTALH